MIFFKKSYFVFQELKKASAFRLRHKHCIFGFSFLLFCYEDLFLQTGIQPSLSSIESDLQHSSLSIKDTGSSKQKLQWYNSFHGIVFP